MFITKKTICIIYILICIISFCSTNLATTLNNNYSTNKFSIYVPSKFRINPDNNSFTNTTGVSININIQHFNSNESIKYDEITLQQMKTKLKNILKADAKQYFEQEIRKRYKEEYSYSISNTEMKEIMEDFKIDINSESISGISNNKYPCFKFDSKMYWLGETIYIQQYFVYTYNEIYTLTISAPNKSDFASSEVKQILNSFTIKNYNVMSPTIIVLIVSSIVIIFAVAIISLIIFINNKNNKKIKEYINSINDDNSSIHIEDTQNQKTDEGIYNRVIKSDKKNIYIEKEKVIEEKQSNETCLPMLWYNFFMYFRLPLGCITNISGLLNFITSEEFSINIITMILCILNLGFIIFLICTIYFMYKKKKIGYTFIHIELILELISLLIEGLSSYDANRTIVVAITMLIWYIPNFIYFKKRKDVFGN